MLGAPLHTSWHSGLLQSRMRIGLRSSRERQVSHSWSFRAVKYSFKALWYSLRQVGQPMEFSCRPTSWRPSRLKADRAMAMTWASATGSAAPNISTPNWCSSRRRPAWGFSYR